MSLWGQSWEAQAAPLWHLSPGEGATVFLHVCPGQDGHPFAGHVHLHAHSPAPRGRSLRAGASLTQRCCCGAPRRRAGCLAGAGAAGPRGCVCSPSGDAPYVNWMKLLHHGCLVADKHKNLFSLNLPKGFMITFESYRLLWEVKWGSGVFKPAH